VDFKIFNCILYIFSVVCYDSWWIKIIKGQQSTAVIVNLLQGSDIAVSMLAPRNGGQRAGIDMNTVIIIIIIV